MALPGGPIGPARVGERWVVRRRLSNGSATDLIGWVETVDPAVVSLVAASGEAYDIPVAEVVAARRAPAAAGGPDPRRVGAAELERIALPGWLGRSEPLGEWTLRAAGGFTGRANSCLAVGDPGVPIAEAAAAIVAYARAQQIPPMAQVVVGSGPAEALHALGWVDTYVSTDVLVAPLGAFLGDRTVDPGVSVGETYTPSWAAAYQESRPNDVDPAVLALILDGHPPRAFASAGDGAVPFAIARGHRNGDWLGIASVWTREDHRRRGWATRLMTALGHWAARGGARYAYLQVATANQAAVTAYTRLGFVHHHRYGYLAPSDRSRGASSRRDDLSWDLRFA